MPKPLGQQHADILRAMQELLELSEAETKRLLHERGRGPLTRKWLDRFGLAVAKGQTAYETLKALDNQIVEQMASRNEAAQSLEKEGEIEAAIPLYELNLADQFWGSLPYDRLRILYTKAHRFRDAIRVCEAYLALPDQPGLDKESFRHHRDSLKRKLDQAAGSE